MGGVDALGARGLGGSVHGCHPRGDIVRERHKNRPDNYDGEYLVGSGGGPPKVDNTTAEFLALALGRWIVERLSNLKAVAGEGVYDAQAAEAMVARAALRQRDLAHRAIQWKCIQWGP